MSVWDLALALDGSHQKWPVTRAAAGFLRNSSFLRGGMNQESEGTGATVPSTTPQAVPLLEVSLPGKCFSTLRPQSFNTESPPKAPHCSEAKLQAPNDFYYLLTSPFLAHHSPHHPVISHHTDGLVFHRRAVCILTAVGMCRHCPLPGVPFPSPSPGSLPPVPWVSGWTSVPVASPLGDAFWSPPPTGRWPPCIPSGSRSHHLPRVSEVSYFPISLSLCTVRAC